MPTSITIPDQLRKKIKKMAALLDTSQAEIISRAIDEYEMKYLPKKTFTDAKVITLVTESSERIYAKYPKRKERAKKLLKTADLMDSISPAVWGIDIND